VNGGDPGAVSSTLRMNLRQLVGDINQVNASIVGHDVVTGASTSTAEVPLRALLALHTFSPFNDRGEEVVANETFEPDSPLVFAHRAVADWFPQSPAAVAAGAIAPATVNAVVATQADLHDVALGRAAPVAGYEPQHWGESGALGVALVPLSAGDLHNGVRVAGFASAHMEYPAVWYNLAGDLTNVATDDVLAADCNAFIHSNTVRVPGPQKRIIFLCSEQQNAGGRVRLIVGRTVPVLVDSNANGLIMGGAEVDISTAMAGHWASVADSYDGARAALEMWSRISGSRLDYEGALATAIDAYGMVPLPPRRIGAAAEAAVWNNENGAPFTEHAVGYAVPTAAGMNDLQRTPSGGKPQILGIDTCAVTTSPTWLINAYNFIVYAGLAGHMYIVNDRMSPETITRSAMYSCAYACDKATFMSAVSDYVASCFGTPERTMWSPGGYADLGEAMRLFGFYRGAWLKLFDTLIGKNAYNPTWAEAEGADVLYDAVCANSRLSAGVSRVNEAILAESGYDSVSPRDDFHTLQPLEYVSTRITPDAVEYVFDILKRMEVVDCVGNTANARLVRCALTTGGFTAALTDLTGYILCTLAGTDAVQASVQFDSPTSALSREAQYRHVLILPMVASGIRELLHSPLPLLIDPANMSRKMHLALTGARSITASTGQALPIMVYKQQIGKVTGAPMTDINTESSMANWATFRI
jgi:hypothetical protein